MTQATQTQAIERRTEAAVAEPMNGNKAIMRGAGTALPLTMNELKFFGQMVHEAGLIAKASNNETTRQLEARAMAKIIAGHAYGFDPVLSMRTFDVINGKLQPTSECTSILIKRSGRYNYKVVAWDETKCDLLFVGKASDGTWKPLGHSIFTIEDAKKAGYLGGPNKHNWANIPRNMLLARAITNGRRLFCADVMDPSGYFGQSGHEVAEAVDVPEDLEFAEPSQLTEATEVIDGEIVDTATGDVVATDNGQGTTDSEELPFDETADTLRQFHELMIVKFGDGEQVTDEDAANAFLNGRDPSVMPLAALQKLLGELKAV